MAAYNHDHDDEYQPGHCGGAELDMEGWLRVTCPLALEPYAIRTLYVWFPHDLPPSTRVEWQVTGAAWPVIVNPIRAGAYGWKRDYFKFRVMNPFATEQAITLIFLAPGP